MNPTPQKLSTSQESEALQAFAKALTVHLTWTVAGLFRESLTPTPKFGIRKNS
ncbi:hypothetical protein IQ235_15015 [Oscillatoriales cyanobacterium LEGE 11467]|uniref:Uncharacterized protein n=1 Tax=Zarconia navalis LEGE 11467 TaxID=1828826 RepID=A0A928W2N5_9CYAN|nr:hypothetical protein [Zarconia navalis]MBE9042090.1 hypothetical protein [Zarconia navalis LEGE 11467]